MHTEKFYGRHIASAHYTNHSNLVQNRGEYHLNGGMKNLLWQQRYDENMMWEWEDVGEMSADGIHRSNLY